TTRNSNSGEIRDIIQALWASLSRGAQTYYQEWGARWRWSSTENHRRALDVYDLTSGERFGAERLRLEPNRCAPRRPLQRPFERGRQIMAPSQGGSRGGRPGVPSAYARRGGTPCRYCGVLYSAPPVA